MAFDRRVPRADSSRDLLRVLGLAFGVAIGVGTMVGGGILRAPGSVIDQLPSPTLALLLWGLAGLHALLGANVIAEVMTALPKSGGLFVPAEAAFGRAGGLFIGWTDWLTQIAAIAALSIASGEFMALILPQLSGYQGIVGAAISLALYIINLAGVREGSALQIAGSSLKVAFLLGLAVAVFFVPAAGAAPAAAPFALSAQPITFWGVVIAYQLITGVYSGWPNPAYFPEEDKHPGKNIPRALFTSVLTVAALYLLVNLALLYSLPLERLRASDLPMAAAISELFGPLSVKIVASAAVVIVLSCNNANIMVGSRILYGLARKGLFPSAAQRVNRGGTPDVALLLTALVSISLTLTGSFELVFLMMGALVLLPLVVAEAALFRLRKIAPDLPRPYRAIGYPWLPGLVLTLDLMLFALFIIADWKSGLSILAAVAICVPLGWAMRNAAPR